MIESFVADMAKEALMQELGPYIIVGFLAGVMFVCKMFFDSVDKAVETRKARR